MKHFFYLLLLFSVASLGQSGFVGIVSDAKTNKPIAFARITSSDGKTTLSKIDGSFEIKNSKALTAQISHVNFLSKQIAISSDKIYIKLPRIETRHADSAKILIRKAIFARPQTDPQQKLNSFTFKSYNKLIVSATADSVTANIDTIVKNRFGKKIVKLDSSSYKFKKLISNQHLFQTETASEFQFADNHLKETVTGIQMSGFKKPVYELLALHLQSFSIYDETYEIFETKYRGPLSSDALAHYNYKFIDTLKINNRLISIVYFDSKKNRQKKLSGWLFIDQQTAGVAKAIIRANGIVAVLAQHDYEFLSKYNLWFPTAKELKIVKGTNDADIHIFGETLKFESDPNTINSRHKQASDVTFLLSKSYFSEAEYNIPVSISRPAIATQIKDDAPKKQEDFWIENRKGAFDSRSAQTYFALDSLAQKQRVESRLFIGRKLINGYVPLGFFDVDLRYLLSYNNYEGFRFGFGGITNDRFSTKYRIEGYSAYGTKDGQFKYNLGGAARIGRFSNTWIGGSYTDDVKEIASTTFAIDKRVFKLYDPRPINVSTFYNHVTWRGYIETKIIPKTESVWQINYARIEPKFNYVFTVDGKTYSVFHLTTATVALQWNPFSDYMQTPGGRIESEKRFPKFTFQFTQSIPNVLGNDFDFGKIDLRAEYEKKFLNGQKSSALIEAGYAYGDAPLTHLYNTSPNNLTKDRLLQRVTLAGKNSFETMYFNEFFSSRYVFLQLKHGSKRLKLLSKIRPSIVFVTRMAWGMMEKDEQHSGISYKTLEDGYFESGVEVNQIFKGLGISGLYRYGPNQLARFEDNLAIKLSFIINIGI